MEKFGTAPTEMRMTAFIAVSVLAAVIIAAFYHHLAPGDRVQSLGLSFVFAVVRGWNLPSEAEDPPQEA